MADYNAFDIEQARHSGSPQYPFIAEDAERQSTLEVSPGYRSLVHESPPANFEAKTPQDELRAGSQHNTPSPFKRGGVPSPMSDDNNKRRNSSNSTPITREFRTPSEWDELMRLKGIIPQESNEEKDTTPGHKSVSSPRQHLQQQREQRHSGTTVAKTPLTTAATATITTALPREPKADIPSYMRATASYESRFHRSQRDPTAHSRPKRVTHTQRSMQVPRFQSSTRINAMEDIHSEMRDEDVYIPLAVRIKLFEQNLRGGDPVARNKTTNSQAKPTDTQQPIPPSLTRPRSPKLLTRQRSHSSNLRSSQSQSQSSQEKRQPLSTEQTNSSSDRHRTLSRISRPRTTGVSRKERISSANRPGSSKTSNVRSSESSELPTNVTKKQKTTHPTTVKPFRFATDQRAIHHQKAFKAKLNLWKEKEKEILDEAKQTVGAVAPQRHRGTKRKVQEN